MVPRPGSGAPPGRHRGHLGSGEGAAGLRVGHPRLHVPQTKLGEAALKVFKDLVQPACSDSMRKLAQGPKDPSEGSVSDTAEAERLL